MKLITFASFKGGAGKTTSLMAACGAMAARGMKVGLFEADENVPLSNWREAGRAKNTWDESCEIAHAADLPAFEQAYEKFENQGIEVAIADTQGGGSDLNTTILASSDLIVLPMALTKLDLNSTLDTYEFVANLLEDPDIPDIPVGVLITQFKTSGKLNASEAECLGIAESLPSFDCRLPARNAFQDIASLGMLHLYRDALASIPAKRIAATHITTAVKDSNALITDLLDAVGVEHAAA